MKQYSRHELINLLVTNFKQELSSKTIIEHIEERCYLYKLDLESLSDENLQDQILATFNLEVELL